MKRNFHSDTILPHIGQKSKSLRLHCFEPECILDKNLYS